MKPLEALEWAVGITQSEYDRIRPSKVQDALDALEGIKEVERALAGAKAHYEECSSCGGVFGTCQRGTNKWCAALAPMKSSQ